MSTIHGYLKDIESTLTKAISSYVDSQINVTLGIQLGTDESFPVVGAIRNGDAAIHLEMLLDKKMLSTIFFPGKENQDDLLIEQSVLELQKSINAQNDTPIKSILIEPCLIEISKMLSKGGNKERKIGDAGEYVPRAAKAARASSEVLGQARREVIHKSLSGCINENITKKLRSTRFLNLSKSVIVNLGKSKDIKEFGDVELHSPEVSAVVSLFIQSLKSTYKSVTDASKNLTSETILNADDQKLVIDFSVLVGEATDALFSGLSSKLNENKKVSIRSLVSGEVSLDDDTLNSSMTLIYKWGETLTELCSKITTDLSATELKTESLSYVLRFVRRLGSMGSITRLQERSINFLENLISGVAAQFSQKMKADLKDSIEENESDNQLLKGSKHRKFRAFKRTGGKDVSDMTPSSFLEKYKMRGFQWGEYVSDSMRADYLQRASASLSDLSDILGISEDEIGDLTRGTDGKKLAISIGARGKGAGGGMAHYERNGDHIINITRDAIQATVGHEYFHAADFADDKVSIFNRALAGDESVGVEVMTAAQDLMKAIYFKPQDEYLEFVKEETRVLREAAEFFRKAYKDESSRINEKYAEQKRDLVARSKGRSMMDDDGRSKLNIDIAFFNKKLQHEQILAEVYKLRYQNLEEKVFAYQAIERSLNTLSVDSNDVVSRRTFLKFQEKLDKLFVKETGGMLTGEILEGRLCGPSSFMSSATRLDSLKKKKESYWSSPHELAARAFESYLADKMSSLGRENNYLVDNEILNVPGPYVTNEKERQRIVDAMDNFLRILKRRRHVA